MGLLDLSLNERIGYRDRKPKARAPSSNSSPYTFSLS